MGCGEILVCRDNKNRSPLKPEPSKLKNSQKLSNKAAAISKPQPFHSYSTYHRNSRPKMLSSSNTFKASSLFMGFFGVQMLLAPDFLMSENFQAGSYDLDSRNPSPLAQTKMPAKRFSSRTSFPGGLLTNHCAFKPRGN